MMKPEVSKTVQMSVSYQISPVTACIIVRLQGTVTDNDLIREQERMFSDKLFQGHYSRLIDATDVTEFIVSADTVRAVGKAAVARGLRKAALVSNKTDLVYGLMRMYDAYASPPAEIAVYEHMQDAMQWL